MSNKIMSKNRLTEYEIKTSQYWTDAKKYIKMMTDDPKNPPWFSFTWNDEARWKWQLYFEWRMGLQPVGIKYLERGTINEFLVPCENPSDFDSTYKPKESN